MMSYEDFLTQIKQNTSKNELYEYKDLCRFCLQNICVENQQRYGIDISDNICSLKQQRNDILNNYSIITKRYLPISTEYPNFVCVTCVEQLSHYALFTQRIEQNANNWDTFLKNNGTKECMADDESNPIKYERIQEIEIEFFGHSDENVNQSDTNIFDDVMDVKPYVLKVEAVNDDASDIKSTAKRRQKAKSWQFVNLSTDFERTCKLCDEPTFSSLNRLYIHQRLMHPGKKISFCDLCGTGFISKCALLTHMKDRHTEQGKTHQCQFCAKLFYSDREVKGHEKLHANARSNVCDLCGKGFNSKTTLNVHMKSKAHNVNYKTVKNTKKYPKRSQENAKKMYRCEQCVPSIAFPSSEERADHRNFMHKIYECDICKNSFITPESLDSHRLLHSDKPRPFVCTVCEATFNQSSHLSSHFKRRHTDEKTHQCSYCEKKFFQNFELNSHVKLIHKKQERVECGKCERDFATVKYLQKHIIKKHSNEASPYDCKICGKKNPSAAMLQLHRRKQHRD